MTKRIRMTEVELAPADSTLGEAFSIIEPLLADPTWRIEVQQALMRIFELSAGDALAQLRERRAIKLAG